jgi:hypothetical protein
LGIRQHRRRCQQCGGRLSARCEVFLGSMGLLTSPKSARRQVSGSVVRGFAYAPPYTLESRLSFAYGGITHCADAFQRLLLPKRFVTLCQISTVFSLRWNLPPHLSCNPKQLDSVVVALCGQTHGSFTLFAILFQKTWSGLCSATTVRPQFSADKCQRRFTC